jgi:hypothetical protein
VFVVKPVTRFFLKLGILALPLAVALLGYVICDPFMVLRSYRSYNADHGVELNRDFVSTQVYLNQAEAYGYDSFIFGNSRSLAFLTGDWSLHLDSKAVFHFDARLETLYGVAGKMRLLDRKGAPIRHVLLVLDSNLLSGTTDREGLLYMKHPAVSGHTYAFHAMCLKTYLTHTFLFPYLATKTTGITLAGFLDPATRSKVVSTQVANDVLLVELDRRIAANEDAYYTQMASVFGDPQSRVESVDAPAIGKESLALLREIRAIGWKHHADVRIAISPLYDQARLNPADLALLKELFGAENVHDFSGANEFTSEVRNYYETSHYRPHVGRQLMDHIYARALTANAPQR